MMKPLFNEGHGAGGARLGGNWCSFESLNPIPL
jgi:hypothetical protein